MRVRSSAADGPARFERPRTAVEREPRAPAGRPRSIRSGGGRAVRAGIRPVQLCKPTDTILTTVCLPPTTAAPTIPVVADDPRVQTLMAAWLTDEQDDIALCGTGQAARDPIAHGWIPRVIGMDALLPVLDGSAAIKQRTEDPDTARIPVVAMSAGMTPKHQIAERTLADALLPKPFDTDELSPAAEVWVRTGGACGASTWSPMTMR